MLVLLDTNVLISYLLTPNSLGAIPQVFRAAVAGEFDLLVPTELIEEMVNTVIGKEKLKAKIRREKVDDLIKLLIELGATPERINDVPVFTRDRKDDYLIAYALASQADYLVCGDADLLDLKQIEQVRIVTPAEFLSLLDRLRGTG